MSSTKRIQGKLFRGESNPDPVSDPLRSSVPDANAALTIDIPKIALPPKPMLPPKAPPKQEEAAPGSDGRYTVPYRVRLLKRLGEKYVGAEKYRLDQDAKKNAHWKRWGPYLSDRQWACRFFIHVVQYSTFCSIGNRPRRLFGKRRCLEPFPSRSCPFTCLQMG